MITVISAYLIREFRDICSNMLHTGWAKK